MQLGLIPGWGGTARLPRLIGLRPALRLILEGATLSAAKAAKAEAAVEAAPAAEGEAKPKRAPRKKKTEGEAEG